MSSQSSRRGAYVYLYLFGTELLLISGAVSAKAPVLSRMFFLVHQFTLRIDTVECWDPSFKQFLGKMLSLIGDRLCSLRWRLPSLIHRVTASLILLYSSVKIPPGKGHEKFDESVGKDEIVWWKGPEKSAQDREQVHQVIP
jgi:hypothetical protein